MISLPDPDGLMVMLLATHRCPLACAYCEMPFADLDLPESLIEVVIRDLDERLPEGRPLTLVWHGGEPLLRGLDFFRWVHGTLAPLRGRRPVRNVIQTNGLLLGPSFLDFMQETGDFMPNISMDGPEVVTGATRGVEVGTYEELFEDLKARDLPFGISVVGSPTLREHLDEALAWFAARGLERVGVTPFQVCGGDHGATPELFAELLLDASGRPNAFGRSVLAGIQDQRLRGQCRFSTFSDGCHRHVLCVDARGDLFTCLRGKWSGLWTWGHVAEGGLEAWWAAQDAPPPYRPLLPEACGPCAWKAHCAGGCPSNALAMGGGAQEPDFYCPSYLRLFAAAERLALEEALAAVKTPG